MDVYIAHFTKISGRIPEASVELIGTSCNERISYPGNNCEYSIYNCSFNYIASSCANNIILSSLFNASTLWICTSVRYADVRPDWLSSITLGLHALKRFTKSCTFHWFILYAPPSASGFRRIWLPLPLESQLPHAVSRCQNRLLERLSSPCQ